MSLPSRHERDNSGYLAEDTIAAIASGTGGGVLILRISGPGACGALSFLCPSFRDRAPESIEARKLHMASVHVDGEKVDNAMAVHFRAPRSFTGEDVVELHLHGSAFVARKILKTLSDQGVRQALPGEFSFRAVRNGKLSLNQAQAVADLIGSSNDSAVKLAIEKLEGSQNRLLSGLAEDLRKLAALGELGIDFSDQDVDEVSLPRLKERLSAVLGSLKKLAESFERGSRIQDGVKVAFAGLPNAGKSSFFNALLGEERSIVSDIAGTTRDVVGERLVLRSGARTVTLRLEDTAGLRDSVDAIERMGIERTARSVRDADLVLFLLDSSDSPEKALEQWKKMGPPAGKALGILTKCDLPGQAGPGSETRNLSGFGLDCWIRTSVLRNEGIEAAASAIVDYCENLTHREKGEVLLTRVDQLDAVRLALGHLERASSAPELDLFASDIRQALNALASLIGETPADAILGQIFSEFCIGK